MFPCIKTDYVIVNKKNSETTGINIYETSQEIIKFKNNNGIILKK